MNDANKILDEVNALIAKAQELREAFSACAVRLADEVVRNRFDSGSIQEMLGEQLRAYIAAKMRCTENVNKTTDACERLTKCLRDSR